MSDSAGRLQGCISPPRYSSPGAGAGAARVILKSRGELAQFRHPILLGKRCSVRAARGFSQNKDGPRGSGGHLIFGSVLSVSRATRRADYAPYRVARERWRLSWLISARVKAGTKAFLLSLLLALLGALFSPAPLPTSVPLITILSITARLLKSGPTSCPSSKIIVMLFTVLLGGMGGNPAASWAAPQRSRFHAVLDGPTTGGGEAQATKCVVLAGRSLMTS